MNGTIEKKAKSEITRKQFPDALVSFFFMTGGKVSNLKNLLIFPWNARACQWCEVERWRGFACAKNEDEWWKRDNKKSRVNYSWIALKFEQRSTNWDKMFFFSAQLLMECPETESEDCLHNQIPANISRVTQWSPPVEHVDEKSIEQFPVYRFVSLNIIRCTVLAHIYHHAMMLCCCVLLLCLWRKKKGSRSEEFPEIFSVYSCCP